MVEIVFLLLFFEINKKIPPYFDLKNPVVAVFKVVM